MCTSLVHIWEYAYDYVCIQNLQNTEYKNL